MELADKIAPLLRSFEQLENQERLSEDEGRKLLYCANAIGYPKHVGIVNISYHGVEKITTEKAREYLRFLRSIDKYSEFKTYYNFDKSEEKI